MLIFTGLTAVATAVLSVVVVDDDYDDVGSVFALSVVVAFPFVFSQCTIYLHTAAWK